ncbi:hypothetical protein [Deinococcus pimensis]|uniref:hypothetical protein n=1 Tax=Deinococcus pimensis TaxID=309888 RepID=UPI00047F3E81|nr:hypothetical protein [Deinococcus pimensis]
MPSQDHDVLAKKAVHLSARTSVAQAIVLTSTGGHTALHDAALALRERFLDAPFDIGSLRQVQGEADWIVVRILLGS